MTTPSPSIYDQARQLVEGKPQWYSGETVTLWGSQAAGGPQVLVREGGRDGGGLLHLSMKVGSKDATVDCGHLNWEKGGWVFDLSRTRYQEWTTKARSLVEQHQRTHHKPRLH